jgi:lysophospholipase L1-like esterase
MDSGSIQRLVIVSLMIVASTSVLSAASATHVPSSAPLPPNVPPTAVPPAAVVASANNPPGAKVTDPAHSPSSATPSPIVASTPAIASANNPPTGANPFETEVTALEARLSQLPIMSGPIVFYGSSSIRLWKSLQQDFSGYAVINCGFGGSRLTDCVRYANRLVIPRKPRAIVIYAGDNDLAAGAPPEKVFDSFKQLFAIFRSYSPSIPIAFVSVKPSPARMMFFQNILRFNHLVEDFLKTQPDTEYVDVCSGMLGLDRKPIASLFRSDRIHLSPAGYEILRKEIGEFLSQDCPRSGALLPKETPVSETAH